MDRKGRMMAEHTWEMMRQIISDMRKNGAAHVEQGRWTQDECQNLYWYLGELEAHISAVSHKYLDTPEKES